MDGCSNALLFWLPVLAFRAISALFRIIWRFNLWILQIISGMPLHYCRSEYRIPAILFGTIGVALSFNLLLLLIILSTTDKGNMLHKELSISGFLIMGLTSVLMLLLCRFLIRKGTI